MPLVLDLFAIEGTLHYGDAPRFLRVTPEIERQEQAPIALDESLTGPAAIDRWLDAGWPGRFVIKPSVLGDPEAPLSRLEKVAADRVVFSSALETAVGARAALRIAGARRMAERFRAMQASLAAAPVPTTVSGA